MFAEAISEAPIVLGFIGSPLDLALPETKAGFAHGGDDPRLYAPYYPGAVASLKVLQNPAQGAGALNWIPEYDQIIRRMPMVVRIEDTLFPSLVADVLRLAQGASTYVIKSSGASSEQAFGENTGIVKIRVGDFEIPTEANGQMWIRFTPQSPGRYLPAWKVLNGEIGEDEIACHGGDETPLRMTREPGGSGDAEVARAYAALLVRTDAGRKYVDPGRARTRSPAASSWSARAPRVFSILERPRSRPRCRESNFMPRPWSRSYEVRSYCGPISPRPPSCSTF